MIDMSKIKRGDTVTLRNGEVRTVAKVKLLNLVHADYTHSVQWQCSKNQTWHDYTEDGHWLSWEEDTWDIVEIKKKENNMIFSKKVTALGHQPRKGSTSLGDWRPSPSQQSAAVEPTQPAQDEMTLRDQFAMASLSGLVVKPYLCYEDLALDAYDIADAMMKARKNN